MIIKRNKTQPNYPVLRSLLNRKPVRSPVGRGGSLSEGELVRQYNATIGDKTMKGNIVVVTPFNEDVPLANYHLIGVANFNGVQYGAWAGDDLADELGDSVVIEDSNVWGAFRTHLEGGVSITDEEPDTDDMVDGGEVDDELGETNLGDNATTGDFLETIKEDLSARVYENLVAYGITSRDELVVALRKVLAGEVSIKYVGEKTVQGLLETYDTGNI